MMKRYLITGSSGYIGSHLFAYLKANCPDAEIDTFDKKHPIMRSDADFYLSQHYSPWLFPLKHYDTVFHLAASSNIDEFNNDPFGCLQNNIDITMQVLSKVSFDKIVFASSGSVYDAKDSTSFFPFEEDDALKDYHTTNTYAYSKVKCEELLHIFQRQNPKKTCIVLRLGNVSGQALGMTENHVPETHLIPKMMRHNINRPFQVYGSADQIRDYVHVLDVCAAFLQASDKINVNSTALKTLNVSALPLSINDIIKEYRKLGPEYEKFHYEIVGSRNGDSMFSILNSKRLRNDLYWKPKYNLTDILKSYII